MLRSAISRRQFSGAAIGGLFLSKFTTRANASTDLSLSELIERHVNARGGHVALDRIERMAVDMEILEKGKVIAARYRCDKSPAYRIDIYDGGKHIFCEGLDADGTWIWPSDQMAAKQGVDDGKRSGLEGIQFNLYGLHAFPRLGNPLALDGREQIAGVNYYVVKVNLNYGDPAYLYIDPETWMISRRREVRAYHPDMDPTKQHLETQYNDFRIVDGVQHAFMQHQVNLSTGEITQVVVLDKIATQVQFRVGELSRSFSPDQT